MLAIPQEDFARFDTLLAEFDSALLSTHVNPDGDAVGSVVGLAGWLETRGLTVRCVSHDPVGSIFGFLDPNGRFEPVDAKDITNFAKHALGIILDASDISRLGDAAPLLTDLCPKRVRIDHHKGDSIDADLNLVDIDAAATGEIVYHLIDHHGGDFTDEMATALYVAILTDTGGFRYASTRPSTHRAVADLLERGVSPEDCYERVYQSYSWGRMKLLVRMLDTLTPVLDGKVALYHITRDMMKDTECCKHDLEGLVDFPRLLDEPIVYVFVRETKDGEIKLSLRSKEGFDVRSVAEEFGGGGHLQAAGATMKGPIQEAMDRVVAVLEERMGEKRSVPAGR